MSRLIALCAGLVVSLLLPLGANAQSRERDDPGLRVGLSPSCHSFFTARITPIPGGRRPALTISLKERPKDHSVPCRLRVISRIPGVGRYTISGSGASRLFRRESLTRSFNQEGRDGFGFRIAPKRLVGDVFYDLHFALVLTGDTPVTSQRLLSGYSLDDVRGFDSCDQWTKVYREELRLATRCDTVLDCGKALPIGCGCTTNPAVRKDYDVPLFVKFFELAAELAPQCDLPFASICICGTVMAKDPMRCVNNRCVWNSGDATDEERKKVAIPIVSPNGDVSYQVLN